MITVTDLHKHHGTLHVLKGISLTVKKGQVDAIIGPSGGGKSTFLRCLNGLEPFQQGQIKVGNHVLTAATDRSRDAHILQAVRRNVGFVFQQFNLFPHLTVLGNLIESPMQVLGEDREAAVARARKLLDRVQLGSKADAKPGSLSGGQQQRVAIARTLMMQPETVLFDEPTSALDPLMAQEVLAVMGDLAKEGQTMMVVTHSMAFARNVATNVHVFAGGHDVECGPPDQVFDAPQHEITKSFLQYTKA
ncbi:MAG: amino acid ABC transporter ATP-binding protein [Myxococcales bacterium]|nr:amino acid ABC transporter ATP-binding protein [Myxococcales bacterium]